MIKGIYHAAAGMIPRESQLEAVSNNLANANTTAHKSDRRLFRTTLNNRLLQGGPYGTPVTLPPELYYLQTDHSQGSLEKTDNPLDVAIAGKGFFVIETENGNCYSRGGNFKLNEENELVNNLGFRVLGESNPIQITGSEVVIRDTGEVIVDGSVIDKLQIVDFEEPYNLRRNGYGFFVAEDGSTGQLIEESKLMQGYIERSNVNVVKEMVQMIELNRIYDILQKAIITQDETLKMAVNEIAR